MADGTGGTFFHNDNGLREGLNRLGAPPECVYVLGFSPRDLKLDGSFHALRVRLKKGTGLELQVRRGYFAHRDAIDPVEQAKQEIQEALLSRAEILDLPVELHTEFVKAEAGIAKLTVFARVDVKGLHLRKTAGQNLDTLTMAGGVFDQDGKYITGVQKVFEVHIKDQELEGFEASGIVISSVLDVMPGSYLVRLVIRDSEGAVLAARNGAVEIP
jgi:hypothetical protein